MYMNIRPQDNNFFISFPSSGQHLIERLFEEIYGYYLPTYYSYCEYYTCCKMIPCAHNKTFNKNANYHRHLQTINHKFNLSSPYNNENGKYIKAGSRFGYIETDYYALKFSSEELANKAMVRYSEYDIPNQVIMACNSHELSIVEVS